ncbi:MAG: prepilin-type N-terminal cleavage/methylation domain-containing protein [Candidatus Komeilibacteria bacterium]
MIKSNKIHLIKKTSQPKGFTLVEMLVAVAIFAIGFVIIAGIYIATSTAQNRAKGSVEYLNEAQLVFEQISRLVRDNDLDQSTASCNCGLPDYPANTFICLKDIANGKTFISLHAPAGGAAGYVEINRDANCSTSGWVRLSDPSINVSDLKFYSKFPSAEVPDEQAMTTITMRVTSNNANGRNPIPLQLQTAVSSRVFVGSSQ